MVERLLRCRNIFRVARPGFQGGCLQRTAEREAQLPRGFAELVQSVEMCRRQHIALSAGKESDAGHRRRDHLAQTAQRHFRHLRRARPLRTFLAGQHHVRFEQHRFETDAMPGERMEHGSLGGLGHLEVAFDGVFTVHEHFRFDDGNQSGFLAQCGESGQGMGIGFETRSAWDALAAAGSVRQDVGRIPIEVQMDALSQSVSVVDLGTGQPLPFVKLHWFAWQAFHPHTLLWQP